MMSNSKPAVLSPASVKATAAVDDLIALARVVADPKALDALRTEFSTVLASIQEATANHNKAAAAAETVIASSSKRSDDLDAREAAAKRIEGDLQLKVSSFNTAKMEHAKAVKKLVDDTAFYKDQNATTLRDGQTKLDNAARALDARADRLAAAERDLAARLAAHSVNIDTVAATQAKLDGLIASYNQKVEAVKKAAGL